MGSHTHEFTASAQSVRGCGGGSSLQVRSARRAGAVAGGGHRPLQYILGAVRSLRLHALPGGRNTVTLFKAAARAGVGRIVHVSITNPSLESDLPYFRGKAQLETALMDSGLPYTILRPAVLFGKEDILIHNIAWILRRFSVFGVFGDGSYRLQPIYVDDLAELAVLHGRFEGGAVIDAVGPETFTYRDLVATIGYAIGKKRRIIEIPPSVGLAVGRLVGRIVGDVVITQEEIEGLMQDLLVTASPPTGTTRLSQWLSENAHSLGRSYSSELARRRDRGASYENL